MGKRSNKQLCIDILKFIIQYDYENSDNDDWDWAAPRNQVPYDAIRIAMRGCREQPDVYGTKEWYVVDEGASLSQSRPDVLFITLESYDAAGDDNSNDIAVKNFPTEKYPPSGDDWV